MNVFPAGNSVSVTVPFQDQNGNALSPAEMTLAYSVYDELENVVQALQTLPPPSTGDVGVTITIPSSANILPSPQANYDEGVMAGDSIVATKALREVQLTMTIGANTFINSAKYVISVTDGQLVLMQNTFQVYNKALLTAMSIPLIDAFNNAAQNDQITALIEAYRRLTKFGYFVRWPRDPDAQNYLNWFDSRNEIIIPRLWSVMGVDRWYNYYPEPFREAMRLAQVAEANAILANDIYAARRLAGVIEEKISDSDVKLRTTKPLDFGVSNATLKYIQQYLDLKFTIVRGR